jgi:hypothetical protein
LSSVETLSTPAKSEHLNSDQRSEHQKLISTRDKKENLKDIDIFPPGIKVGSNACSWLNMKENGGRREGALQLKTLIMSMKLECSAVVYRTHSSRNKLNPSRIQDS